MGQNLNSGHFNLKLSTSPSLDVYGQFRLDHTVDSHLQISPFVSYLMSA